MKHSRRATHAFLILALGVGCAGCPRPSGPDVQMTLQLSPVEGTALAETALAEARETIQKRLEMSGFDGAVVEPVGRDGLSVRLSGVEDPARVRGLIGSNAFLELRLVRAPTFPTADAVLDHFQGQLPPNLEILEEAARGAGGQAIETRYYAVEKQPVITGRDIRTARPSMGQLNDPIVEFRVKPEATAVFSEATAANIGSSLAIVLDRQVVSAPVIRARISEYGIIEGGFTEEQAQDLAIMLRSGPLPARVTVVDERIISRSGG